MLCLGAVPAATTMYFREKMPETPRYTLHKMGNATQMVADMMYIAQEAGVEAVVAKTATSGTGGGGAPADSSKSSSSTKPIMATDKDMSFFNFMSSCGVLLLGTAMCWFLLDVAFYSQNLFQKDIFLQIGWLPPANKMNAMGETANVAKAQALIALGSTIPGYWATVFTVDYLGRRTIQLMGFIFMTAFMGALAGGYHHLLNPNNPHNQGLSNDQPGNKNGWIAM